MDGSKLASLSDQDLRSKLRLNKPAEVMAIRGAVNKLVDDSLKVPNRRVSSSPRLGVGQPRDRAGSFEQEKHLKTIPQDHRNTISSDKVGYKQPKLVQGSASELVDRECKYSGWIRKQGGGYKNCEYILR